MQVKYYEYNLLKKIECDLKKKLNEKSQERIFGWIFIPYMSSTYNTFINMSPFLR